MCMHKISLLPFLKRKPAQSVCTGGGGSCRKSICLGSLKQMHSHKTLKTGCEMTRCAKERRAMVCFLFFKSSKSRNAPASLKYSTKRVQLGLLAVQVSCSYSIC
ncbi:UNVERIFIED_CONTAM: hypothetical protein K2H54_034347 [Gekko kuhli]